MNDHDKTETDSEQLPEGRRLGKEAKIGLALIGILLVTFCVALGWRLQGATEADSHDGKETAAVTAPGSSKDNKRSGKKTHSVAKPAEPTVVAAKASVGEAPKDAAVSTAQWSLATDAAPVLPKASGGAPEPPIHYMPMPPAPEPVQVRDPYAAKAPEIVEPTPPTRPELPKTPDPPAPSGPYVPAPAADAQPATPPVEVAPPGLRLIEPPPAQPDRPPVDTPRQVSAPPVARSSTGFLPPETNPAPKQPVPALPVADHRVEVGPLPVAEEVRAKNGKYTVQPNDSYWTICEKLYGTGAYFKALVEHNRQREAGAHQLAVGEVISAPAREVLEETYPGLCPKPDHREVQKNHLSTVSNQRPYGGGRTYMVQEGDSLFNIARWELGKASRWFEIYQLNRAAIGSDYNYLPPGLELVLPEEAASDRLTRQPDAGGPLRR